MLCTVGETKWNKKTSGESTDVSGGLFLHRYQNSSAVLSLRTMCSVEEFGRRSGAVVSAAMGAYSLG